MEFLVALILEKWEKIRKLTFALNVILFVDSFMNLFFKIIAQFTSPRPRFICEFWFKIVRKCENIPCSNCLIHIREVIFGVPLSLTMSEN